MGLELKSRMLFPLSPPGTPRVSFYREKKEIGSSCSEQNFLGGKCEFKVVAASHWPQAAEVAVASHWPQVKAPPCCPSLEIVLTPADLWKLPEVVMYESSPFMASQLRFE